MKTISKWMVIAVLEAMFCFWLLGYAAKSVSSANDFQVKWGVACYVLGLLIIPGVSVGYVAQQIADVKHRHKQLKEAFPEDDITLVKLLDSRR